MHTSSHHKLNLKQKPLDFYSINSKKTNTLANIKNYNSNYLVSHLGFEPRTFRLKAGRSTDWASDSKNSTLNTLVSITFIFYCVNSFLKKFYILSFSFKLVKKTFNFSNVSWLIACSTLQASFFAIFLSTPKNLKKSVKKQCFS